MKKKPTSGLAALLRRPLTWKIGGWAVLCALAVLYVYFWRVFYSFDRLSALTVTALAVGLVSVLYWLLLAVLHFVPTLAGRAAVLLAAVGLCFCFANPPMQTPDESEHYLRAYAISMGRFDFDADRGYPADVDLLMDSFYGAYTNANNGAPIKQYYQLADPENAGSTKLPVGPLRLVTDCFDAYARGLAALQSGQAVDVNTRTEPLIVMLLPYFPQALGMALGRLFGADALACVYWGRIFNLMVYVALAYLTLQGLQRWKNVFLAVLFLPLSVYMAASLSYDAQLLGLYALATSLLLRDKVTDRRAWAFVACVTLMNVAKPWINLLWAFGVLFIRKQDWQAKLKRWQVCAVTFAAGVAITALCTWYGRSFRFNYGEVGRMLDDVGPLEQLFFVIKNPLRTVAVLWGTLTENQFFLTGLGNFGALDTYVPAVAWASILLLVAAAFAEAHRKPLSALTNAGLSIFTVVYAAAAMMALYITYTPVGMVRVIGLQARYFLPVVPAILVLLAQALGLLQRRAGAVYAVKQPVSPAAPAMLPLGFAVAALSALWLCEAYFIGPVTWVLETLPA